MRLCGIGIGVHESSKLATAARRLIGTKVMLRVALPSSAAAATQTKT